MYDVIIVGARCSGSPLAMLLARRGYRVLLVDRATFPSDTISTHHIHQPGVERLDKWGLLEELKKTDCPPITLMKFDTGEFSLTGTPFFQGSVREAYAPRRRVLDTILVEAAVRAGAELREGFAVTELVRDGNRVTGIRGRERNGQTITERASLVVGADGVRSLVAKAVNAPVYLDRGTLTCSYFSYWSGIDLTQVELYPRERTMVVADPTNDGLTMVVVAWQAKEFGRVRSNIENEFMRVLDEQVPELAAKVRAGERAERFLGTGYIPNFFRKAYGSGWALVGDAGYHKDPITAQGITNGFSHAELLFRAIDEGLSGRRPINAALADYEYKRNAEVMEMYDYTCQLASFEPPPPEFRPLLAAIRDDPEEISRFLGLGIGTVPVREYFSPFNINRLISRAAIESVW